MATNPSTNIGDPRADDARGAMWKLHWLLRVGVFMEFVGHGACGVGTKAGWLPYFHVFAIPDATAWKLMPVVGSMDIALGVLALLAPRRALLLYMGIWGCFTASLRPAAGEAGWEFLERAYNFGVPLSLLFLHGFGRDLRDWFARIGTEPSPSPDRARGLLWMLRLTVALMLVGHGGFGAFMGKENLLGLYRAAGLGALGLPLEGIRAGIGFFEIGLGISALFAVRPAFFGFVCAWKIASEALYIVAGSKMACWEFIERGGGYVAPLAVLCLLAFLRGPTRAPVVPEKTVPLPA